MIPRTKESYDLFHQGTLALAEIEENGIRIDEQYMDKAIRRTKRKIGHRKMELSKSEIYKVWKTTYKEKFKLRSGTQLGKILFDVMGLATPEKSEKGRYKTDEKALNKIDHPFVKDYLEIRKLEKALSTYLIGLNREVKDGLLHPFFNLHTTQTYRSSSQDPNFQNIPIRDDTICKLIRRAFIPRPGRRLIEIDYAGIEIRIAACYHKDSNMIRYINDKTKDLHRDMAMECYILKKFQVNSRTRYCGKNMFVFPQFYGDWYIDCARSLWNAIDEMKLMTEQGVPLKKHLREQGIRKLGVLNPKERPVKGTFEKHIQQIEKSFWGKRFFDYAQWKKDWYNEYKEKGWFLTKTEFICQGYMRRNEVINYPIQGSAFHCLLWSLIQLVRKELPKRKMKTLIIGQIHDSIVSDVPDEEVNEYLEIANYIMTKKLRRRWDWIIVPLEIEAKISESEGSWAEMSKV